MHTHTQTDTDTHTHTHTGTVHKHTRRHCVCETERERETETPPDPPPPISLAGPHQSASSLGVVGIPVSLQDQGRGGPTHHSQARAHLLVDAHPVGRLVVRVAEPRHTGVKDATDSV